MPVKFIAAAIGCAVFLAAFAAAGRRRAHLCAFLFAVCSGIEFQFRVLSSTLISKPLIVHLHFGGAQAEPVIILFDIPLVILALLAFIPVWTRREKLPAWTGLDTLIALFFLASVLSLYAATHLGLFFYELLRMCKFVVLYVSLRIVLLRHPEIVKWLIAGLITALAMNGAVSMAQQFLGFQIPINVGGLRETQTDTLNGISVLRVMGLVGQSNTFTAWLITPLAFALGMQFISTRIFYKVVALSAFLLGFVALFTTLSRNGWMTFAICCSTLFVCASLHGRVKLRTIIAIAIPAIGVACVLSSTEIAQLNFLRFITDDKGSTSSRIDLIRVALTMIAARPFTGIGLNNFDYVMMNFDPTFVSLLFPHPVHNIFLLVASETGTFSLLLYVGIGMFLLYKSIKLMQNPPGETAFLTGFAGIAVFISLCFNGLLDWGLRRELIIVELTILASLIIHFSMEKGRKPRADNKSPCMQ